MAKLKVLKTGETDIRSTDIWRFCVHSDYPTQKVYTAGQTTLTITAGNTIGSVTINHSLGYAPIVMAMFGKSNGRFMKVFGHTVASNSERVQQYFLVDITANYIVTYSDLSNHSGSLINCVASIGDVINFQSSTALPAPLQPNTNYYVKSIHSATYPGPQTVNVFDVSATPGGTVIDITDGGGATYDAYIDITHPVTGDISGWYDIKVSTTNIVFDFFSAIGSSIAGVDVNIPIYYIILYDQI